MVPINVVMTMVTEAADVSTVSRPTLILSVRLGALREPLGKAEVRISGMQTSIDRDIMMQAKCLDERVSVLGVLLDAALAGWAGPAPSVGSSFSAAAASELSPLVFCKRVLL